ncbi:FAD-dependent oxidoreductase [Wenxinia saemankumensis]|uniref:2-polyprenyl-6-methoxyphenol hydroxylase n=1 Tax=Wenxinia saemankumensis TaxID=1447782 RepID=A0A1M6CDD0_9RHOB|nr:NAD(P)/FAD-dependent oxidoreductase [Wenxinia saemankumensis]SHI58774.1 2-polyprenyl-6-methoxyphenol hydroxylase [Wenxinia saemankumensis]
MARRYGIGIAGAGIGGLAAAALLARDGHEVTVLDRFARPAPVGSGLVIQPVGQAVLRAAGAGAAFDHGARIARLHGHEATTGRTVLDVAYGPGRHGLAIHRAALFEALLEAARAAGARIVPGAEVTGAEVTGAETTGRGARFLLAGDRFGPFDLVVDAAGANSPLSPLVARPLSYGAIWGTVRWPQTALPPDRLSQCYRRADRMIGVLPVGRLPGTDGALAAIFWSLPRDGEAEWRAGGLAAWKDEARALWPAIAPFLDGVTDAGQMTMARYSHGSLRRPCGAGVVHIGDAAHRASPQLGQGANMALLDAAALTRALALHPLDAAPRAYALARRWHVAAYQAMSALFTPQYQSDSRALPVLRDRVLAPLTGVPPLPRLLSRLVAGDLLPPLGSLSAHRDPPAAMPARAADPRGGR